MLRVKWAQAMRWVRQHLIAVAYMAGLASSLLAHSISGIIGNSADRLIWNVVVPWLRLRADASYLSLIGLVAAGMGIGLVLSQLRSKSRSEPPRELPGLELSEYSRAFHLRQLRAYYSVWAEIARESQLCLSQKTAESLDRFIKTFFRIAFEQLGPEVVEGGGIMLPEEAGSDWLAFWRMASDQALSPKRFWIGPDDGIADHPRGVAGHVFRHDAAEVVRILDQVKGPADHEEYHVFDLEAMGHPRIMIPYASFICLPIHWNKSVVGVLSIESKEPDTFDEGSKRLLQPIADHLGTVLALCKPEGLEGNVSA